MGSLGGESEGQTKHLPLRNYASTLCQLWQLKLKKLYYDGTYRARYAKLLHFSEPNLKPALGEGGKLICSGCQVDRHSLERCHLS